VSGRVIVDDEADEDTDDMTTDIVPGKETMFQKCPSCITQHEQNQVEKTSRRPSQQRYFDSCRQLTWANW